MGILYDANNVKVGVATAWIAPWIQPTPTPLIADTVNAFGTAWAGPWLNLGATDDGWKVSVNTDRNQVRIEEQSIPVDSQIATRTLQIQAALAEETMQTLRLAWGGTAAVVVAPSTGVPGTSKMTLTEIAEFWTIGLETKNRQGFARRFYIEKATIGGSGDTEFRRAAGARLFPIQIDAVCDPTAIKVVDITAATGP